jgi:NAD(P)-dependent dehydrogenase (short-subunit alcohol dehydrogenase family)
VEKKSVLVTGASSGIGKECALLLASRGFQVFAGVRRAEDAAALASEGRGAVVPVMIDVTVPSSIQAAVQVVRAALDPGATFALVNNAGITVAGPLEVLPIDSFRQQIEVNVIGQLAVTQAFLPLIRERTGRIVIMGSVLGRVAPPLVGSYGAAKYALEAITDALSVELHKWRIPVVLMEPGNIATPIWEKGKNGVFQKLDALEPEQRELYRDTRADVERLATAFSRGGIPTARVAETVAKALSVRRPRARYRIGLDSKFLSTFAPICPDRLRYWITRRVLSLR